ncbi:DNA helicase [Tanacetum coccineum]
MEACLNNKQELVFVYGHGGRGKTFLWKTIIYASRSKGRIVLAVASSGIASMLLPAGRTAHSHFKLPLDPTDTTVCSIKKNRQLATLIKETCLIIWGESPMNDRRCFETLDRTLQDLLDEPNHLFGENMRLSNNSLQEADREKDTYFAQWLLDIGNGHIGTPYESDPENTSWINVPDDYCIPDEKNGMSNLIKFIYDDETLHTLTAKRLQEKATICPKNEMADIINAKVLSMLLGNTRTYISFDEAIPYDHDGGDVELLYRKEYLNTLSFAGLPPHRLELKIGTPIMLLRNIDMWSL